LVNLKIKIFIERRNINTMLTNKKIAIIGVGKIGETLLSGMIKII